MAAVRILTAPFDPWQTLQDYEQREHADHTGLGATACFVGRMRDFNEGDNVRTMTLEHYPGMAERVLENLLDEALSRWPLEDGLIVHRVGEMQPAEPIVLAAVWSSHRAAAFEACRFLMEALKSKAPFWKKEALTDGSERWVEHNTPG
jgi:molybdopterin synthase catalytic subunit